MDIFMQIIYALLICFCEAIALLFIMILYFCFRRKSSKKITVEIAFILVLFIISTALLTWVSIINSESDVSLSVKDILYAIPKTIESFTLSGIGDTNIGNGLVDVIYVCVFILTGLTFVAIITSKASYEFYSIFSYLLDNIFNKKKDIYVFTDVTEDSVALANSIRDHYNNDRSKFVIMFCSCEIEPFDRKNPLHIEILSNSYFYFSYRVNCNSKDGARTIIDQLHIKKANIKTSDGIHYSDKNKSKVAIFALGCNAKLSGQESNNSNLIFDEISGLTNKISKKLQKKFKGNKSIDELRDFILVNKENEEACRNEIGKVFFSDNKDKLMLVDLYILTDKSIDYDYYKNRLESDVRKCLKDYWSLGDKVIEYLVNEYKKLFQLNIINEAVYTGVDLSINRIKNIYDDVNLTKGLKSNAPTKNNDYRVLVLGFGANGEEALNSLYVSSSYINDEYIPSQFIADVCDPFIDNRSGLFLSTHPLFACINHHEYKDITVLKKDIIEGKEVYYSVNEREKIDFQEINQEDLNKEYERILKYYPNKKREQILDNMQFPIVSFHKLSSNKLEFIKEFQEMRLSGKLYNSIIIAFGNDEDNIVMTNSLIENLKHESEFADYNKDFIQYIYVNIRDINNRERIDFHERDRVLYHHIRIIPFGVSSSIYNYDCLVDISEDSKFCFGYNRVNDHDDNLKCTNICNKLFAKTTEKIEIDNDNDYYNDFLAIKDNLGNETVEKNYDLEMWIKENFFEKMSNKSVYNFEKFYSEEIKALTSSIGIKLSGIDLAKFILLEHERWNRFYICNGWVYASYISNKKLKNDYRNAKEHDCLLPFILLPKNKRKNDIVNVFLAIKNKNELMNNE